MGQVKSAFEKAMERAQAIGSLTPEEKEDVREREKIKAAIAAFFRGELTGDSLREKLSGSRPSLLTEAQLTMIESMRPGPAPEEFGRRKDGILAIEALKPRGNSAAIESSLDMILQLTMDFEDVRERAVSEVRQAVDENPQLRMRAVRGPDGRTTRQALMSVEEAVQEQAGEFLAQNERRYEEMFAGAVRRLKEELA